MELPNLSQRPGNTLDQRRATLLINFCGDDVTYFDMPQDPGPPIRGEALVDGGDITCEVFAKILKREGGLEFSLGDMFEKFVGRSSTQCMDIIEHLIGRKPPADIEKMYRTEIDQTLAKTVTAVAGVENMLGQLMIPCCVASNGPHEKMKMTLGRTNLLRYFEDVIFSAADVARGKPSPDVYLYAAESIGVFAYPGHAFID